MPRGEERQPIIDAEVIDDNTCPGECECADCREAKAEWDESAEADGIEWEPQALHPDPAEAETSDELTQSEAADLVPFERIAQLGSEDAIEAAFARSIKRIEITKRLKAVMLSMTNRFDWVAFYDESDPDGKPYLQGSGCDKVVHAFGIEMEHDGGKRIDNPEGGFEYVYTGRARSRAFSDIWLDVVGSRWSDDGFFTKGGKYRADPGDVRKAGHTNFMNRSIKTALGIRTITWEELEAVPGMEDLRKKVQRVGFRDSAQKEKGRGHAPAQPGEKHAIQTGPHYVVKLNANDVTVREALKKAIAPGHRTFTGKDGSPPYVWLIGHNNDTVSRLFDFAADNPSANVTPVEVPPEEMP